MWWDDGGLLFCWTPAELTDLGGAINRPAESGGSEWKVIAKNALRPTRGHAVPEAKERGRIAFHQYSSVVTNPPEAKSKGGGAISARQTIPG